MCILFVHYIRSSWVMQSLSLLHGSGYILPTSYLGTRGLSSYMLFSVEATPLGAGIYVPVECSFRCCQNLTGNVLGVILRCEFNLGCRVAFASYS
jgi:hypothetical protein